MYNMLRDGKVSKAAKFFKTSVQGAMMYYSCPAEYKVDDVKKKRYETQLHEDKLALQQAFSTSHETLTGKLPSGETLMAINAHIKKLQDQEALIVGKAVEKRGCTDGNFRRLDAYFENVAAAKAQGKKVQ